MGLPDWRRPETSGRTESGYYQAIVETARVVNVNIQDWTVDCVSMYGNRRFFDIQVMSPYFHYVNGEGVYAMPEVGAVCWVCQESSGMYAQRFVLGFQAPHDERTQDGEAVQAAGFRANRQNLNPGDIMLRTRDENFIALRRGGVVQIGASPANQRIFVPIGNLIRDFCFGYELATLAGDMKFENDGTDVTGPDVVQQEDAGQTNTRVVLRAKTIANEPGHAVVLTAGSHKDDAGLRLSLEVRPDGAEGSSTVARLTMDKEGTVSWDLEKDFSLAAKGSVSLVSEEGDAIIQAVSGTGTLKAKGNVLVESEDGTVTVRSAGEASLIGENVQIEGGNIALKGKSQLGGPGGERIPKGDKLVSLLRRIIQGFTNPGAPFGPAAPPPGNPMLFPGLAALEAELETILSSDHTVT